MIARTRWNDSSRTLRPLMGILERGEERIEARRAELAEVRYALTSWPPRAASPASRRAGALEPLSRDGGAPAALPHRAHHRPVRACTMVIDVGAGIEQENFRLNQDLLADGRFRQRTIYPMDIMDTDAGRAVAASFAGVGRGAAAVAGAADEFAVFDETLVVAVAEWGDPEPTTSWCATRWSSRPSSSCSTAAFDRALPVAAADDGQDDERPAAAQAAGPGSQGRVHRALPRGAACARCAAGWPA